MVKGVVRLAVQQVGAVPTSRTVTTISSDQTPYTSIIIYAGHYHTSTHVANWPCSGKSTTFTSRNGTSITQTFTDPPGLTDSPTASRPQLTAAAATDHTHSSPTSLLPATSHSKDYCSDTKASTNYGRSFVSYILCRSYDDPLRQTTTS